MSDDTPMSAESRAELAKSLRKRAENCEDMAAKSSDDSARWRLAGKARAYAHAAELVEAQP